MAEACSVPAEGTPHNDCMWPEPLGSFLAALHEAPTALDSALPGSGPIKDLPTSGIGFDVLLTRLKNIVHSLPEAEPTTIHSLTNVQETAILASTLALMLQSTLGRPVVRELSLEVTSAVSRWLHALLALESGSNQSSWTSSNSAALLMVCRTALRAAFPALHEEGYFSFTSPPVLYTTDVALGESLCAQLSLPASCVHQVPINHSFGQPHDMDVQLLADAIAMDEAAGRKPLIVLARASVNGHVDDIAALRSLCSKSNTWLHVFGDGLSLLLDTPVPNEIGAVVTADSFSVEPSSWWGLPSPVHCTFFRDPNVGVAALPQHTLMAFPLWMVLQRLGTGHMKNVVPRCTALVALMQKELASTPHVLTDHADHTPSLSAVFRFAPSVGLPVPLLNKLNQQILLDLQSKAAALNIHLVMVDQFLALAFQPLHHPFLSELRQSQVSSFVQGVRGLTNLISCTLECREAFSRAVDASDCLANVQLELDHVGLGAVRYVPSYLFKQLKAQPAGSAHPLAKQLESKLDTLNIALANDLQEASALFSGAVDGNGHRCIRLGVHTEPMTRDKTLALVQRISERGDQLEEESDLVDTMQAIVKAGIQEASAQLTKDSSGEGGIVRAIPVVGSLWSWWSPAKQPEVKGRAFDLTTQTLDKSDRIIPHTHVDKPATPAAAAAGAAEADEADEADEAVSTSPREQAPDIAAVLTFDGTTEDDPATEGEEGGEGTAAAEGSPE